MCIEGPLLKHQYRRNTIIVIILYKLCRTLTKCSHFFHHMCATLNNYIKIICVVTGLHFTDVRTRRYRNGLHF